MKHCLGTDKILDKGWSTYVNIKKIEARYIPENKGRLVRGQITSQNSNLEKKYDEHWIDLAFRTNRGEMETYCRRLKSQ